jgi:outer membrane protein TolC
MPPPPALLRRVQASERSERRRSSAADDERMDKQFRSGLTRAVSLSKDVASAEHRVRSAISQLQSARLSRSAPLIDALADGGLRNPPNPTGAGLGLEGTSSVGVRMTMPLFDGGRGAANEGTATANVALRSLDVSEAQARVAAAVRAVFWEWRLAGVQFDTIREWRRPFRNWVSVAHQLYSEKTITAEDLLNVESVDAQMEETLLSLEDEMQAHRTAWVGLTDGAALEPVSSTWPVPPPLPTESDLELAIERSVVLSKARAAVDLRQSQISVQAAKSEARADFEARVEARAPSDSGLFLGVRVVIPLFDRGINNTLLEGARAELAAAQAAFSAMEQQLKLELLRINSRAMRDEGGIRRSSVALSAAQLRFTNARAWFEEFPDRLPSLFVAMSSYLSSVNQLRDAFGNYYASYNALLSTVGATGVTPTGI